jgi:hypothetical protein
MPKQSIGKIGKPVKIAAGLFWADYGILGAQVEELTTAGVDWIHLEMRDGKYMDFGVPRRGMMWLWWTSVCPTARMRRLCWRQRRPASTSTVRNPWR